MRKKKLSNVIHKLFLNEETIAIDLKDIPTQSNTRNIQAITQFVMPEEDGSVDQILVTIQHMFISGDFEGASKLIQKYQSNKPGSKEGFFSWYHMDKLIDWVRNIYKYTNMKDINKNYYDDQMRTEVEGVKDLKAVKVKETTINKFLADAEKVLKKKLEMK